VAGSDADRRDLVLAAIEQRGVTLHSNPSLADRAAVCINLLCPAALEIVLGAGALPGDIAWLGDTILDTILQRVLAIFSLCPYVQSTHALPHALESLRLVLVHTKPGDWLVGTLGRLPLERAAFVHDPAVSRAVLARIEASPGGFPAHAVAASPGILQPALQFSTASFVKALLDAGADPNFALFAPPKPMETPLH